MLSKNISIHNIRRKLGIRPISCVFKLLNYKSVNVGVHIGQEQYGEFSNNGQS